MWDANEAMHIGKCLTLSAYIRKWKRFESNGLNFH